MDSNCRDHILSEDYADFIIDTDSNFKELMTSPEICYTNLSYGFIIAHVPINIIPRNFIFTFDYGIYPGCYGLLDIDSLEASNVVKLRNISTFNLTGQGVLIGIVDTGIDYSHPAFRKEDGTSKIVSIWDQTIQSGTPPTGFSFGSNYTQAQINEALLSNTPLSIVPSVDEVGHGTNLAGIAAGNVSQENNFSGVVPDAEIVVVKLKQASSFIKNFWVIPDDTICYQNTDIMLGVEYLRSVAKSLKRPISICIALGSSQGSHDGIDNLGRYLSLASLNIGTAITIAGGNEGNIGHHYMGEIGATVKSQLVELKVGPNESGFVMELWGQAPNSFSIDILSPTGEYIPRIPARLGESHIVRFLFESTVINVDYFIVETHSGDQLILMRFHSPTEGIWQFRVYVNQDYNSKFHIWLPIRSFISDQTFFTSPNPDTTLTSPGNTLRSIVVTAYDHTNQSLYINTSRGFTRSSAISPDICAPGVNIVAPSLGNSYNLVSGTSVAAAHTTGVAAMLLEWGIIRKNYLLIDSVQIANLLKLGAKRFPSVSYPDPGWGYGVLDIYSTFNNLRGGAPT